MLDLTKLCDIELEQALLGSFFLKPALVSELASIVMPEHFFEPMHQQLYGKMLQLAGEGRALTPATIEPYFAAEERIGTLTVPQYLGRLLASATGTLNAPEYARLVREYAARRALREGGLRAQQLAADMELSPAAAASEAISDLDKIVSASGLVRQSRCTASEAADKLIYDLKNGDGQTLVPSGLADLDDAIGGFGRGEYHILAGRPSMGKTALAGCLALNAARRGFGTMFFSLEMRTDTLMARMFSDLVYNSTTPIPYRDILRHKANRKHPSLNEHQLWRLEEARESFSKMPMVIDDQSALSVADMAVRARRQAAKFAEKGIDLQLVIIDHKDFIKPSNRYGGNKVAETGEISAALKSMFKELNVAGLLLCQLSREVEKRENKRPSLSDLRWAGDLEQDADLVMFAYREAYYLERTKCDDKSEEAERIEMLESCQNNFETVISKQRNGPCKTVDLLANMPNNAIRNLLKQQ